MTVEPPPTTAPGAARARWEYLAVNVCTQGRGIEYVRMGHGGPRVYLAGRVQPARRGGLGAGRVPVRDERHLLRGDVQASAQVCCDRRVRRGDVPPAPAHVAAGVVTLVLVGTATWL